MDVRKKKTAADCDRIFEEYIKKRKDDIGSEEELSFLYGYYSHLVTDAEFTRYIRDDQRVAASWQRIKRNEELAKKAQGMPETIDYVKKLISKGGNFMKKVMLGLFITSIIVFFIDWGIVGIRLLNGDYDITVGIYVALGCVAVMTIYILYRLFNNRCPHCGMIRTSNGKYCSFCGEKIDD